MPNKITNFENYRKRDDYDAYDPDERYDTGNMYEDMHDYDGRDYDDQDYADDEYDHRDYTDQEDDHHDYDDQRDYADYSDPEDRKSVV